MSWFGLPKSTTHIEQHRALDSFFIALFAVMLDYFFHSFFTSPMEIPAYFIVKFLFAFAVAWLLVPFFGSIRSGFIFSVVFSLGYYGLLVYALGLPLSVTTCTGYICQNQVSFLGITDNLYIVGAIEFFVHWVVFAVATIGVTRRL